MGFEVVRDICLQCRSWIAIAEQTTVSFAVLCASCDGDDVDPSSRSGPILPMVRLAAAADVARQTDHRHQYRHLLAWFRRRSRTDGRLRPPVGGILRPAVTGKAALALGNVTVTG